MTTKNHEEHCDTDRQRRRTVRRQAVTAVLLILTVCTSCLKFGDDEETTPPTSVQVDRCRSEMYLNPSVDIIPLGYKRIGSGIDDAIWFKFKTTATDLTEIFDSTVVDVTTFTSPFTFDFEMEGVRWWDVEGKTLLGGQVSLPNARYMNVGIYRTEEGCVIYIMWHET
jgi:hypothetical protein